MAIKKPAELETYLTSVGTLHNSISHVVYGSADKVAELFGNEATSIQYVMVIEWPDQRYRDAQGTVDVRHVVGVSILKAINSEGYDAQNAAISECMSIWQQMVVRMRKETFQNSHHFIIQDMGRTEPILSYLVSNAFGCRTEIEMGDWISLVPDSAVWSDGYSG